ncbi:MAG: DUF2800 domain-containing protein [Oscillospiraceae bacterium]|jgi:hypothetical protein|nr:DUF2800 domain-containing protein [Oscillospiraceae bacterium]
MPTDHAKLSASASHRWLHCTAAPTLEAQFPQNDTKYTKEGTLAHTLAEEYVRKLRGETIECPCEVDDPVMHECASKYAAYVMSVLASKSSDAALFLEEKLTFGEFVPHGFGTADCLVIADDLCEVIDFKYGAHVQVSPEDNPQMKIYALGVYAEFGQIYNIERFKLTIFQPRMNDEAQSWNISVADLLAWGEWMKPIARAAYDGPGRYCVDTDVCRFCKANGRCQGQYDHYKGLFDMADQIDPQTMSPELRAEILNKANGLKTWLNKVENGVSASLMLGETIPGWKIVEGRADRKITDAKKAIDVLTKAGFTESDICETNIVGITALEKLVGKKKLPEILGDLLVKPTGKPTLVQESDKRSALQLSTQMLDAFDDNNE